MLTNRNFATALLILWSSILLAAQDSTVIEDNAPVRLDPKDTAEIMEYLAIGSEIRISNYPLPGGWYKVRAKNGIYGWVNESFLSVKKIDPQKPEDNSVHPERDRLFYLRVLGGFDFFVPGDLNDLFGFSELNTGVTVGGEFGYFLSNRVAVSLRGEALFKDLVAKENLSGVTYNMAIRSYPVMLGFDFYFVKLAAWRLSLGLFGGIAFSTSFSTQALNLPTPNVVVIDSSPFTGVARLNLTRPLGRILSVFIEGGYRYLQTTNLFTVNSVNGGTIYIKNSVYKTRVIDLTGPEVAVGLGIHF